MKLRDEPFKFDLCPQTGKVIFISASKAYERLPRFVRANRYRHRSESSNLGVYHCEFCGHWHVGHNEKPLRSPKRKVRRIDPEDFE